MRRIRTTLARLGPSSSMLAVWAVGGTLRRLWGSKVQMGAVLGHSRGLCARSPILPKPSESRFLYKSWDFWKRSGTKMDEQIMYDVGPRGVLGWLRLACGRLRRRTTCGEGVGITASAAQAWSEAEILSSNVWQAAGPHFARASSCRSKAVGVFRKESMDHSGWFGGSPAGATGDGLPSADLPRSRGPFSTRVRPGVTRWCSGGGSLLAEVLSGCKPDAAASNVRSSGIHRLPDWRRSGRGATFMLAQTAVRDAGGAEALWTFI